MPNDVQKVMQAEKADNFLFLPDFHKEGFYMGSIINLLQVNYIDHNCASVSIKMNVNLQGKEFYE